MSVTISSDYCTVQNHQQITLEDYTVKMAYWCLVKNTHGTATPRAQERWAAHPCPVEWPIAWCGIKDESLTKKQQGRAYLLMHSPGGASMRLYVRGVRLPLRGGLGGGTMWHGVFECTVARSLWEEVEGWWTRLGGKSRVQHPMCKLTFPTEAQSLEVAPQVWRVLCACMLDILWVEWTAWAHRRVRRDESSMLREWKRKVSETVGMLWL